MVLPRRLLTLYGVAVLFGVVALPGLSKGDESQLIRSTTGSGNLYEKLIVQSSNAFYAKEPTLGTKRIPTPAFGIFYRLKTDTPGNESNGYYRIGKRNGEPVGWIKKEFVAKWNTRFGLEPSPPDPDRHFTVYQDENGRTPRLEFIGKEGQIPDGARRFALIVNVPDIESSNEIYPVVVFTGSVESGGARQREQMALYNLQLEVVFVIASTYSMEDLIEAVREVADRTANTLREMPDIRPVVHFGLVEYRDAPPNGDFAARVKCRLTDGHDTFVQELNGLGFSSLGQDDWPDDVIAGMALAISDAGWRPNSSKHVIVLGDCPTKDGYDPVLEKEQQSATGKSLIEIMKDARPMGGSDSERALAARNFHAVCNNHPPIVDQYLEQVEGLPQEKKKEFKELVENPEMIKLVRDDPVSTATALVESGMPEDAAIELVKIVRTSDNHNIWQQRANKQFQTIAANDQQLEGYFVSIDTHRSPTDKERTVEGLVGILKKAYQALAVAREGKGTDAGDTFRRGGSISRAIYQVVGTKGDDSGLNQVEKGYAALRDENGRLVAHKRVMVFKEELMRLYSVLDSLHTTFKSKSNKADRQNVADILDDLKRAVASQAAGQTIEEGTDLATIITFDFPLKTPALEISASQIAVMTTPAFNNWLDSLGGARDRAKSLVLGGKTDWTTLNNEDQDQFTFLRLSELP